MNKFDSATVDVGLILLITRIIPLLRVGASGYNLIRQRLIVTNRGCTHLINSLLDRAAAHLLADVFGRLR